MNLGRVAGVAGLLAICYLVGHHAGSAAADPEGAKEDTRAARYARAQLRLAELTLQKANEINRKVRGTLSAAVVAQFADDVEFAKTQLQTVTSSGSIDSFRNWLTRGELALRSAEAKYKKATRANQVSPGAVDNLDIERMRLGVELAGLQLERGKSLVDASPEAQVQWQIEMFSDTLARAAQQITVISQNRLQEF